MMSVSAVAVFVKVGTQDAGNDRLQSNISRSVKLAEASEGEETRRSHFELTLVLFGRVLDESNLA